MGKPKFSCRLFKFLFIFALLALAVLVISLIRDSPKLSLVSTRERALVSPYTYRYVHDQPLLCKNRKPFLVFMVPVAPQETESRAVIRRTWANVSVSGSLNTLTVFFMGVPEEPVSKASTVLLENESRTHMDIVQMNFRDSYQNLTIKTVMMMHWVATHCPEASYVMKVDADIFVNVFYLVRWLKTSSRHEFITGSVITDGRPRRDHNSKWYVSQEQYPEDTFPAYTSGAGYVLSTDLASRITWACQFVPLISLEDVYIGLCLRVLGIRPSYGISLPTLRNLFEIRNLEYDRCTFSRLILVNGFNPSRLLEVWQDFVEGQSRCWMWS